MAIITFRDNTTITVEDEIFWLYEQMNKDEKYILVTEKRTKLEKEGLIEVYAEVIYPKADIKKIES